MARMAMTRVVRAPWTRPAQMLRPSESVPKGCSGDGVRKGSATISNGWCDAISGAAATSTTSPSQARPVTTRGLPMKRCRNVFTRPP